MVQKRKTWRPGRSPRSERGVAMILTMIVMAALLLGGVVSAGMHLANLRSGGQSVASKRAYDCAEAGLGAARRFLLMNSASWAGVQAPGYTYLADPSYTLGPGITGQAALPGGTGMTYRVLISDNFDELPPSANDPQHDTDQTIVLHSSCTDPALNSPIVLDQYLTLSQVGPVNNQGRNPNTYSSTSAFTGGAGTNLSGGITGVGPGVRNSAGVSALGVDLRGNQVRLASTVAGLSGNWSVLQSCGAACPGWQSVSWTAITPAGTTLTVQARSASNLAGLLAAPWVPIGNGATLPPTGPGSLMGSIIEVQVILGTATSGATPSLGSITIAPY